MSLLGSIRHAFVGRERRKEDRRYPGDRRKVLVERRQRVRRFIDRERAVVRASYYGTN
jgi:hypothetical protein